MEHSDTPANSSQLAERVACGEISLADVMAFEPAVWADLVTEAESLVDAGRAAEAQRLLRQLALADDQSPTLTFLLGSAHAHHGDYGAAVSAYDEALERNVRTGGRARFEVEVRWARAHALLGQGRVAEAQTDLLLAAVGPDTGIASQAQALLTAVESKGLGRPTARPAHS